MWATFDLKNVPGLGKITPEPSTYSGRSELCVLGQALKCAGLRDIRKTVYMSSSSVEMPEPARHAESVFPLCGRVWELLADTSGSVPGGGGRGAGDQTLALNGT